MHENFETTTEFLFFQNQFFTIYKNIETAMQGEERQNNIHFTNSVLIY